MAKPQPRVILFSCNWHPYNSLEDAGRERLSYSAEVLPIRLNCLGRITPGIILNAFKNGAAGVYLAGCPEGECRHQSGGRMAEKVVQETASLITLLGYSADRLHLDLIGGADGRGFVKHLERFIQNLGRAEGKP